jgi:hypothetical protein
MGRNARKTNKQTSANNPHAETIKYLINKDLFIYLKTEFTFRNTTMFDVTSLSFSARCRRPAVIAKTMLSNDEDRENTPQGWGGGDRRR